MRFLIMSLLCVSLISEVVEAQLQAEQIGVSDFPSAGRQLVRDQVNGRAAIFSTVIPAKCRE